VSDRLTLEPHIYEELTGGEEPKLELIYASTRDEKRSGKPKRKGRRRALSERSAGISSI
jgi:hypothetical protein